MIAFVLHGDGAAASWAAEAKPGDTLGIGGPRSSFVVKGDFDFYLLVGDETALPAIGRRIEELPQGPTSLPSSKSPMPPSADAAEHQTFTCRASVTWIERDAKGQSLLDAVRAATLPPGIGYIFIAGEQAMSATICEHFVAERGHNPDLIKSAGYWRRGAADFYDGHAH